MKNTEVLLSVQVSPSLSGKMKPGIWEDDAVSPKNQLRCQTARFPFQLFAHIHAAWGCAVSMTHAD